MNDNNVRILDWGSRWFEPIVKEAIHIRSNRPLLNRYRIRHKQSPFTHPFYKVTHTHFLISQEIVT